MEGIAVCVTIGSTTPVSELVIPIITLLTIPGSRGTIRNLEHCLSPCNSLIDFSLPPLDE
jgi:hypothetical protein